MTDDITVVTVTYESRAVVGACLEAARRLLPGAELVVVDNASTDGSADVVGELHPDARVVSNDVNEGFGRACNRGARAATRGHVLFLNPDVVLEEVDAPALAALLGAERLGLVAGALASPLADGGHVPHVHPDDSVWAGYRAHTWGALRPRELRAARHRVVRGGDWASGALLLARRSELDAVGGFDPRFFLYEEDRDLGRRYRRAGLPIRGSHALRGRHAVGGGSALDDLRAEPAAWNLVSWLQYH